MLPKIDKVVGSFPTFYKQAVLTHLVSKMVQDGSGITFYNFSQGQVGYQLKESHLHKDAIWLYKWLRSPIGQRSVPDGINFIKPWLKEFADVNTDVAMDKYGFPKDLYLPGNDLIVQKYMRATDRLHIHEPRDHMHELLTTALGEDPRVQLHKYGADTEEYFRSIMPSRTARALIYIELNQNSTYVQQLRARNALHAILKRFPTATYLVTWDQHGDHMPWDAMEAFTQTGYKHCYGSVQYSEKDYAERKVAEAIKHNNYVPHDLRHEIMQDGNSSVMYAPVITPDNGPLYPQSIKAFQPGPTWEGAGAAVLNAGAFYGAALQNIGESLRSVLNKPNGVVYGRWGSLYEPHVYKTGGGDFQKQSYRNPGIAMSPDYQVVDVDTKLESFDRQYAGDLLKRMPHYDFTNHPNLTDMNAIAREPYHLSENGKQMIEKQVKPNSSRDRKSFVSTYVMDAVEVYAKSMEVQRGWNKMMDDYAVAYDEKSLMSEKKPKVLVQQNATVKKQHAYVVNELSKEMSDDVNRIRGEIFEDVWARQMAEGVTVPEHDTEEINKAFKHSVNRTLLQFTLENEYVGQVHKDAKDLLTQQKAEEAEMLSKKKAAARSSD